jgi:hypothetical protein
VLSAIQTGGKVEIGLNAYVHRWQKRRDDWCGAGFSQPVRVLIKSVFNCAVEHEGPADISGGYLKIGAVEHDNGIELPYKSAEPVVLRLELIDSEDIEIAGRGILVEAAGAARYIEDLPPDLRPKDIG